MHRTVTYSLEKFPDCLDAEHKKIVSFSIRTTDGEDEALASRSGDARGTTMSEELIRLSLVSYANEDGPKEIKHPFPAFDKWSTKARNFVVAAWKKLATPDEKEIADFFASATENE
jgi:hypothetical protein